MLGCQYQVLTALRVQKTSNKMSALPNFFLPLINTIMTSIIKKKNDTENRLFIGTIYPVICWHHPHNHHLWIIIY